MNRLHTTATRRDSDTPRHDSFLDIVANIVGILVILVMVVSVRVARSSHESQLTNAPANAIKAETSRQHAAQLVADIQRLRERAARVAQQALIHQQGRDHLTTMVATAETELAKHRNKLDAQQRHDFDLQASIAASRGELSHLNREQLAIDTSVETEKIESLPTPLSTDENGKRAYIQIRGGRIVHIPFDELVGRFQASARRAASGLQSSLADVVGPVEGFRLRYQLRRVYLQDSTRHSNTVVGSRVELVQYQLLPASASLGETLDEALAANSQFRRGLRKHAPDQVRLTVWVYPDSFTEFSRN